MELCMNSRMTNFSPSFCQMRRLGSGKFSDAEVMGKQLHCFKQMGQQSKKQLTVKMSIFSSDVGTEVKAYLFNDYWEDIGTIRSFFEANLSLTAHPPSFSFYDATKPMYTSRRNLPPSKIDNSKIVDSIVSHGSFLDSCFIEHSVVGIRSRINSNVHLKDTVMLGADYYETDAEVTSMLAEGRVPIGIGENKKIKECIIDKNARIGKNVTITNSDSVQEADRSSEGFYIRSGITVILKNSTIPDRFVI